MRREAARRQIGGVKHCSNIAIRCEYIQLHPVDGKVLLVIVKAETGDQELLVSGLAIVAHNIEARLLQKTDESIKAWARQSAIGRNEIQILANSMTEVKRERCSPDESETLKRGLRREEFPDALRLRSKLAGIHEECL